MSFDNSRIIFDPWKDYCGVVMEQGRVQTDADWNDWLAEQLRRLQAGTLDSMGRTFYPVTTPFAFQITSSPAGSVNIGRGRMYVDGILVDNHGDPANASWDPALAEMSGSPQPPPASDAHPVPFESQPYFPGAKFPTLAGDYLVYLDVWRQPITFIEDPELVDPAIGVDTTGRLKTVWQVNVHTPPLPPGATCATANPQWPASSGQLTTNTVTSGPSGPCCLTTGSGYTGPENQLYRIEIHSAGSAGGANAYFKWSRENASVQTTITAIATGPTSIGTTGSVLTVQSLGRDQVLGFSAGNWVEITNQINDNLHQSGSLYQIDHVDVAAVTITLTTQLPGGFSVTPTATNTYTRIVRWDQSGKVYKSDGKTLWWDLDVVGSGPLENGFYGIAVPTDGSDLILENGIVISFSLSSSSGSYQAMDYWSFAARTATGKLDPQLNASPPRGVYHHYAQLAIATVGSGGTVTSVTPCRPSTESATGECSCCCTCTVGTGGMYNTIAAAIQALPDNGGEVCILPGDYYENVVLSGKRNVVIRGCQWHTHVYSEALAPGGSSGTATPASASGLRAVFTIVGCENIELTSFAVTAADGEVGILLDRTPASDKRPAPGTSGAQSDIILRVKGKGDRNVILQDLVVAASTMPAIIAVAIDELKIMESRILMEDVESLWAAAYLSGDNMYFVHNWVGLGAAYQQSTTSAQTPTTSVPGRNTGAQLFASAGTLLSAFNAKKTPGGIHLAGPSKNVFVIENDIVGGTRNGITLGNFIILDSQGNDTGQLTGVMWQAEDPCSTGSTGQLPPAVTSNSSTSKIGAGGIIYNLHIDRNRIHQMGMAGIGVVGFWNLDEALEIISIVNLSIVANLISRTMLRRTVAFNSKSPGFAYGAISLADVENLMVRDNVITDFGFTPGAEVCGIFVLHGQMVEISRNQIRETRDWSSDSLQSFSAANNTRAGIMTYLVTPPTLEGSAWTKSIGKQNINLDEVSILGSQREAAICQPGLPALRIQENVVRVAIGLALEAFGYGPFSIVNNHFSSGGPVTSANARDLTMPLAGLSRESSKYTDPLLVEIFNLGLAIEDVSQGNGFFALYENKDDAEFGAARNLANASSGAVLFANNQCQLEAWAGRVTGFCSVAILSLDNVLFNSNRLWLDGPTLTALVDGIVLGITVQISGNRLQEGQHYPVIFSAATLGIANVTSQNVATYCVKAWAPAEWLINTPNLILWPFLCPPARKGSRSQAAATNP